ncbi:DUF6807 family protein [Planctomicrobium sp. SH664]|uniref:DUF6807 family protein n=1 Tax=Planctomicrobium sp. SH664 TaxID=3448125 RepID=UPI003F5C3F4C
MNNKSDCCAGDALRVPPFLRWGMRWLTVWALAAAPAIATAEPVNLIPADHSLKVMIGDDVFTVYRYAEEQPKPFFLPVTGPGGYELLKQAVADAASDPWARQVIVATNSGSLVSADGQRRPVAYPEVLTIARVDGNQLWLQDKQLWIAREEVAPLAAVVTRLINPHPPEKRKVLDPDYYDHPHHRGIWCAVDEVNGIKFWKEDGKIVNRGVTILKSGDQTAEFEAVNHWLGSDGTPVLVETAHVTVSDDRLLTYHTKLTAHQSQVTFENTKEGMFAIRLPNTMREVQSKGLVDNADGLQGTNAIWGRRSPWVTYRGPVAGHDFAVTLLDPATNPWPSRHHVRNFGVFAMNPFGSSSYASPGNPVAAEPAKVLQPGESFEFRYGVWVHQPNDSPEQTKAILERVTQSAP